MDKRSSVRQLGLDRSTPVNVLLMPPKIVTQLVWSICLGMVGWSIAIPAQASSISIDSDIPEEVLRAEIITEAARRSMAKRYQLLNSRNWSSPPSNKSSGMMPVLSLIAPKSRKHYFYCAYAVF